MVYLFGGDENHQIKYNEKILSSLCHADNVLGNDVRIRSLAAPVHLNVLSHQSIPMDAHQERLSSEVLVGLPNDRLCAGPVLTNRKHVPTIFPSFYIILSILGKYIK